VKRFLIALQFLTILPLRIRGEIAPEDFGRSLLYFPVVGLLLGLALAGTALLAHSLPHPVTAVLILILSVVLTGGLHLDGFADTCDGFYGRRSREKILEIMRDSRVGAMGVTGIVCLLALKGTLIAGLPPHALGKSLVLMAVFGRWSQVLVCRTSRYARPEGKARDFVEHAGTAELLAGTVFAVALFLFLMRLKGLVLFVLSLLPLVLFLYYTRRKLGGVTGDVIGAANEIAEVTVLFLSMFLWEM
jgi:adenosylcobinamide-GDP ribazoletransferase